MITHIYAEKQTDIANEENRELRKYTAGQAACVREKHSMFWINDFSSELGKQKLSLHPLAELLIVSTSQPLAT